MKIKVDATDRDNLKVIVHNIRGEPFLKSPLEMKLPKEPYVISKDGKSCNLERHQRWQKRCEDKLSMYLHQVFVRRLYGDLEITFEGLNPQHLVTGEL